MAFYRHRIDISQFTDEQILAAAERLIRHVTHGDKLHWGDEELGGNAIKMLMEERDMYREQSEMGESR